MLIEVPSIAANQFTMNKATAFRNFRRLVEQYDSNAFHLAAENYRDHIVFAARALNQSDWRTAVDHVFSIGVFKRSPEFQTEQFKKSLTYAF
jgi:hypothetical protein